MQIFSGILLFVIFSLIALMHIYWAFGGKLANKAVIPVKYEGKEIKMPGAIPTLLVSIFLLLFGLMALQNAFDLKLFSKIGLSFIDYYGNVCVGYIFFFRAIGDFNYVGFFKKIKHTSFARNDTYFYSPLCVFIALLILILLKA